MWLTVGSRRMTDEKLWTKISEGLTFGDWYKRGDLMGGSPSPEVLLGVQQKRFKEAKAILAQQGDLRLSEMELGAKKQERASQRALEDQVTAQRLQKIRDLKYGLRTCCPHWVRDEDGDCELCGRYWWHD